MVTNLLLTRFHPALSTQFPAVLENFERNTFIHVHISPLHATLDSFLVVSTLKGRERGGCCSVWGATLGPRRGHKDQMNLSAST